MKTERLRLVIPAIAFFIGLALPLNIGAMFAGQIPGSPVSHVLDPIIDNGTVQLGINPEGHLNVPGGTRSMPDDPDYDPEGENPTTTVGLRYVPTNGESTAPGCLCEGWGVANANEATGTFAAYANIAVDGVKDLVLQPGTGVTDPTGHVRAESVGSAFRSVVTTSNGRLRVTHSFHPSPSPNLYQVDVTIENIGETPVGDLRYRRVMDWDIAPFTFSEWVEIHVGAAGNVLRATTDGFQSANPLSSPGPGPFAGSPPTLLVPGSADYFGGPDDQGALFDFTFGALSAGASRGFRIYYGAAASRAEALAAIASVGAEVYSLGLPRKADFSAATTGPHAFVFAFAGVGGAPVNAPPVADGKVVTTAQDTAVPVTLSGSDAETAPADFSWMVGTPGHGMLSGTPPNLTYTPQAGYSGPDSFSYTIKDGGSPNGCGAPGPFCAGPLTSEPAIVSITVAPNHTPTTTVSLSPLSPRTNDILTATTTKGDVDENAVTLTFVWRKTTGEITTTLRTFITSSGLTDSLDLAVLGNGDRGDTIAVEVTPNDGTVDGTVASASVTVVNSPPVLSATSQVGTEGVLLSFQVSATDPDGSDARIFSASNLPPGATFDAGTRTFAWTPSFAQGGPNPYFVQFTASDGQLIDMKTVSLAIADVPSRPDRDGDGVPDDIDNCPDDPNPTQADVCHNSPQPTSGTSSTGPPGTVSGIPVVTYNLTVTATGGDTSWAAPSFLTGTLHCHIIDRSTGDEVPPERVPELPLLVLDEDGGILVRVPAGQTTTLSGEYDPGLTHPTLPPGAYDVLCEYRNLTPRPDPLPDDPPVWIGEIAATTTTIVVGGPAQDVFLHGAGGTANPPTLLLDHAPPTSTLAKFKDSPPVNFGGGNPWKAVGTWSASPSVAQGAIGALSPLNVWLGLRNSDDQGTQFDLRAEVYKNGLLMTAGETRCITGIGRNPANAKKVTVSFGPFDPASFDGATDTLSLRILARIGTTSSGQKCPGPGGSHSSAIGLRLYFDAVNRSAQFTTEP